MENNGNNNTLKIVIGILIVVIVILLGYLVASSIFNKNNTDNNLENNQSNNSSNVESNIENNNSVNNNKDENNNNNNNLNNNQENHENNAMLSTNWSKYEVSVNNKVVALPTDYNELSGLTGFVYKETDLRNQLEDGYYTMLNMYNNDKLALYVEVLNDSEDYKLYKDCKITRISQTKYQVSQGANAIVFPGGLKAGDSISESEIISLFGTPDNVKDYSSDNYVSKTYLYAENKNYTTYNHYEIEVVNGIINQIELDKRD